MSFLETLGRARAAVEQQGRVSMRALGRELGIEGDELEEVVEELVDVQQVVQREDRILVWVGADGGGPTPAVPATVSVPGRAPRDYTPRHLADRILQSRAALEGERKQVTVLFADIKGSMELAEQLDPEQWHQLLDRFLQILTDGVHRFEGTVNQYTGDGLMALFGAPIAHEDHAQRACFTALHLRDAVRGYAAEVRERHGIPFGVRIGLNSGTVVVGRIGDDLRMDYTAQGHVVGLAQRMEALAESGHICLSEHTRRLVEGYFQLQDLGRTKVKGVAQPVGLFDLEGVGPFRTRLDRSRARGLSTFVGRDAEIGLLDAALGQALAGHGRIVGVVAEAGVGKSRLCYEFLQSCRAKGIAVYEGHCPAHGKTIPNLPVLELLRSYFGVIDGDDPRTVREKIAGRLLLLDRDFEPLLPLIWEFLRVPDPSRPVTEPDQAARQRQLKTFVRRLVRARSEQEPAVILLDDLHWIDPASDELLAEVADAVRGTRTLLLGNFRPEYQAAWMQRADYQQLPLTPLGPEAIGQLLRQLLGPDPSVADLPAAIAARTQGNPFFTEEVIAGLIESGQLEGSAGVYRLARPIERLEIPPTVHGVLAARIDRLAERDKVVLTTAAIIGRNFDAPLLSRLTELTDAARDAALRALCDLDLLVERALYPVAEYAFKHPLTHEVAYGSQLQERRRSLHAALAQALEEAEETPALLAHHWDEAGRPEPAVHWHGKAAEEAGLLRTEDAVHHWERICQLLDVLPETPEHLALAARAHAQVLWAEARRGTTTERAREIYERANDLAERAGDPASLARSRASYAVLLLYTGQPGGLELAREAFEVAERSGNVPVRILARWACAAAAYLAHSIADAIGHCDAAIELCGDDLDRGMGILGFSPWLFFRAIRGTALAITGRLEDGRGDHAVTFADHGDRYRVTQAICGAFRARLERVHGDHVAGLAAARRGAEFLENLGAAPGTTIWAYEGLGRSLLMNDDWDGAQRAFEHALRMQQEHNTFRHMAPECLAGLAAIAIENGDLERAGQDLVRATELAHRQALRVPLVDIHLVSARLARVASKPAIEVEQALAAATASMHETGAHGLRAESHRERARLCEREGDADGRRRELTRALELYRQMGAAPSADRVASELAS